MYLKNGILLQDGKYRIVRFIKKGGFGCTYEACHILSNRKVAIKEFFISDFCNRDKNSSNIMVAAQSKKELVDRLKNKFIREARSIWSLNHRGIVRVSDVFEENNTAYYVIDYIEGKALDDIILEKGRLSESDMLRYIRQVADTLRYVHSKNILHLDIKPSNIMIDAEGNAILIDFGASKQYDKAGGADTSTLTCRTLGYAPLEQIYNKVGVFYPATDIYALGATMYAMLTGSTPPDVKSRAGECLTKSIDKNISRSTRNAIEQSMKLYREERPQSIDDFLKLLDGKKICWKGFPKRKKNVDEQDSDLIVTVVDESEQTKPNKNIIVIIVATLLGALVIIGGYKIYNNIKVTKEKEKAKQERLEKLKPQEFTVKGVSFTMIAVENGTFQMGATMEQNSHEYDEIPVHDVTLSDYYIGETEVTQELWSAIMNGDNPSKFKGGNKPVEQVSWNDCRDFITKLNQLTGKKFRLPTEAEWEFAARGGNKSDKFKYSGGNIIDDVAWYSGNSKSETHDVKTKSPNELQIYDMSGNVNEWCWDWYGNYIGDPQDNPTGQSSGYYRVVRGGNWKYDSLKCRVSSRANLEPEESDNNLGLRLAMDF